MDLLFPAFYSSKLNKRVIKTRITVTRELCTGAVSRSPRRVPETALSGLCTNLQLLILKQCTGGLRLHMVQAMSLWKIRCRSQFSQWNPTFFSISYYSIPLQCLFTFNHNTNDSPAQFLLESLWCDSLVCSM